MQFVLNHMLKMVFVPLQPPQLTTVLLMLKTNALPVIMDTDYLEPVVLKSPSIIVLLLMPMVTALFVTMKNSWM